MYEGWPGRVMNGLEWVTKFIYLNFLWFMFTVMGLVVFGFMPATAALFAVIRKWYMGEHDFKVLAVFWRNYKQDFVKANLIGFILAAAGVILSVDVYFLASYTHWASNVLLIFVIPLLVLYVIMLIHAFPVFVHFDVTVREYFKLTLIIGVSYLGRTVFMIVGLLLIFLLLWTLPVMMPFFAISSLAAFLMWISLSIYQKVTIDHYTHPE